MSIRLKIVAAAVAALPLAAPFGVRAQGLPAPTTWKWITDAPAEHQTSLSPPEGKWLFGVMAPGWHITTRPGAVLFEPSYAGTGRFSVEAEMFLFPGTSQSGVGLLLGGQNLGTATPSYSAFLIRRDGSAAIERHEGDRRIVLAEWVRAGSIVPGSPDSAVRNLLRVDVDGEVTRFHVNGVLVAEVGRPAPEFAGTVGLRVGADLDVHVTNLDLTLKLAQPRPATKGP